MGVETELLGLKNRYDGKEFRVIEREDGTIAVLAGDTVIVDSGVTPVTAIPSGPGVVDITSEGKSVGVAQHVRGVQSKLIVDGGTDTGLIRQGAFSNLSGATWTITEGTDADGFYVQLLYTGVGGTHAIAAFPTALDLSSGGGMDWVFDVEFPSGVESPAATLSLFLSNNSTLSNSASRTAAWNPGGTVGALKPGRNCFFSRIESSVTAGVEGSTATGYYGSNWSVNGSYTTTSPITHASIQFSAGAPEVGTIIKLRRVYYNNINTPSLIFGCDDCHKSVYQIYKIAASLGVRGVLPIVGSFVGLASYMTFAQIKELASLGFTPVNHTWGHISMRAYTYEQARAAIAQNQAFMLANGLGDCPILVYPGGHYNDAVIQAAKDLGYKFARTAGKRSLRLTPDYGLENPYRLGSFDTGGQTYDTIRNAIRAGLTDAGCEVMWLYGHNALPGNPATNSAAPGDTNYWYFGWHRALQVQIGQWIAQGLIRPMSGQDFVDSM